MSMMRFGNIYPELGPKETRAIQVVERMKNATVDLPLDEYGFVESYCAEANCDCRRVMMNVFSRDARKLEATINHAFDPPGKNSLLREQTFLDPLHRQSRHAPALLDIFVNVVLGDKAYRERLERHYAMFKAAVNDPEHPCQSMLRKHGLGVQSSRILPPPPRRGKRKWR